MSMENGPQNILLCTINDSESLAQIFSSYALYSIFQNLGCNPVIYDDICRLDTTASEYVRKQCCVFSGMYAFSNREEHLELFDLMVTGSSGRWKYADNESIDSKFLNFGNKNVKRTAYAPSFGKECNLPLGPKNAAFFLLERFHGISVADNNTLSILGMEFGINAEKVCHPILLTDRYPHSDIKEIEGLFIFTLFESPDSQKQKAAEMAEESLRYRVIDFSRNSGNIENRTVDEYLNGIEKSSLIVTDSAAVMHLAIIYQKPFIAVLSRKENDSTECLTTLENLGLTERVIYIEDDVREKRYLCKKPIRYEMANNILYDFRAASLRWLEDQLKI